MKQLLLDLTFADNYNANVFHEGACNTEAYRWLSAWPLCYKNMCGTAIYGEHGAGKTHLLNIWAEKHKALRLNPKMIADTQPRDVVMQSRHFVVDDIDHYCDDTWFFHFYNLLGDKYCLVTAQTPPCTWPTELKDLHSRWMTFQAIEVMQPDDATLYAVFKKLLQDKGMILSEKAMRSVLNRRERTFEALKLWVKER